jgi:hypothetical protein
MDTGIVDMWLDWRSYNEWLNGEDCRDMGDDEYGMHILAQATLERRILAVRADSATELAAQIEVATFNWEDDTCANLVQEITSRAILANGERIAA